MPEYIMPGKTTAFHMLDGFTRGYIECAFFTENGPGEGQIGDAGFDDLAPEALARMVADCEEFQTANAAALAEYYEHRDEEHAGHDLWLTRNGHGAGFWDRGLPGDLGERLTQAARLGETGLYLGDDGRVYLY